jgi:hypothetical protein
MKWTSSFAAAFVVDVAAMPASRSSGSTSDIAARVYGFGAFL